MLPSTAESLNLRVGAVRYTDTGALTTGKCDGCGTACINLSKVKEAKLAHMYCAPSFKAAPVWKAQRILRLCGACASEALAYAD